MPATHDLKVPAGTYTKDGEEKTKWKTVGVLGKKNDGKPFMCLDPTVNLAGFPRDDDGPVWVQMFKREPREESASAPQPQTSGAALDDDIPFMRVGREGMF